MTSYTSSGDWFSIPGDGVVYHPTEIYTSPAATRTATAGSSAIKDWDVVEVVRVVVGATTNAAGTLAFTMQDESTALFTLPYQAVASGSVTSYEIGAEVNRLLMGQAAGGGGFSVAADTATADITIVYRKYKATDNLT